MPIVNIALKDDDYNKLQDEYKKAAIAWPEAQIAASFPTFEQWLGARAIADGTPQASGQAIGLDDVRVFNGIEKLIIALRPHGFGLAHIGKHNSSMADSARELAETIVRDLHLSQQQTKRIQELVEKEIADLAHVGVTNRTYGALHEAYRELVERTDKALDRLGEERAIGRVEGAIAILVNVHVMDRQLAKEKADAFKTQARNPKKRSG